jgi:hypothetical protein
MTEAKRTVKKGRPRKNTVPMPVLESEKTLVPEPKKQEPMAEVYSWTVRTHRTPIAKPTLTNRVKAGVRQFVVSSLLRAASKFDDRLDILVDTYKA